MPLDTAKRRQALAPLPSFLAMALHVSTFFRTEQGPSAFSYGLLLWSWLPYAICLAAAFFFKSAWPAFVAGLLALSLDLMTFDSVFLRPGSSTAAIGLLYAPLVNLFVVPIGLLAGWGLSRWQRMRPSS